jgi:hypothetical protein
MLKRLFPRMVLIVLAIGAGVAFFIGILGAALRHDSAGNVFLSGLEAMILAFVGGLLARSFISFLLWTGRDHPNVSYIIGWAFFLWPGAFDLIPRLLGKQFATKPVVLLWMATSVGALTGTFDGMWQTHAWVGAGVPAFILDETWGLNGTTQAGLLHIVNFTWGDHVVGETRTDAHRYKSGFAVKPGFAFTEGSVMSSNTQPQGSPLFNHENTHVWQNRGFGPFFILSYVSWLIIMLIPGLIVGAASGAVGTGITALTYFDQPWEVWGYAVQGANRATIAGSSTGIMSDAVCVILGIIIWGLLLALAIWAIYRAWSKARSVRTGTVVPAPTG